MTEVCLDDSVLRECLGCKKFRKARLLFNEGNAFFE